MTRERARVDRAGRLAAVLTEAELAYLSRAVFRQRIDQPQDEPDLVSHLDPLISVARCRAAEHLETLS